MMKKTLLFAALAAVALCACQKEPAPQEVPDAPGTGSSPVFSASTESAVTRTALSENGGAYDVVWRSADQITVVDGAATPNVGVYSTTSTTTSGTFSYVAESGSEAAEPTYKAWYPSSIYNAGTPTLPATQDYVAGNISGSPMFAESGTTSLSFKNLCGIIRLNVSTTQSSKKVRRIILSATQGMSGPISNAATLVADSHVASVSGTVGVTLDCGEGGVAISSVATPFHIAVPANTYTTLKITVVTTDGEVQTRTSNKGIVVNRSEITDITLGFGSLAATSGVAPVTGGGTQEWVQLWAGGPRWAKFNVGSTISTYAGVTEYSNPSVVGGYYSYKGRYDSTADANGTSDTATYLWGSNWATPTGEQENALLSNCIWEFCDGSSVQYEEGCTLAGWKVSGKDAGYTENSIFIPLAGIRDQNSKARETVGTRACLWSTASGGSGAYFINMNSASHEYVSANTPHGLSVRAICVNNWDYVDLSATATANTYIVSASGRYKFRATIKGNGGLDPITGATATTIDPADIAGVRVLWELSSQGRAIKHDGVSYDISYANGYVYFSTPDSFVSGDACVAVYDSSDNILWSWVIWATPEPGTMTHNGATFMDRNLGAIDVGNCMRGFLFEWGRKDAFSAANGGYDVYPYVPVASSVFTHSTGPATMAYAIAHPTDWVRGSTYTWMGDTECTAKPWRTDVKTIYDPCPAGWRIPVKEEISDIAGLPNTGIGGGYDAGESYKGFGNPGTGYYWTTSSDDGKDERGYAFCNDGRNIQHWGQDQGYAIRPVRE